MSAITSRKGLPSPASLGLNLPRSHDDLHVLGWYTFEHQDLLRDLSQAAAPDAVLNGICRLISVLRAEVSAEDADYLRRTIETNSHFRHRLFALMGVSSALTDHIVAHPTSWRLLERSCPTRAEMFNRMLASIGVLDITEAGLYRARLRGKEAENALRTAYRDILIQIAAEDLASTSFPRNVTSALGETIPRTHSMEENYETPMCFTEVTRALSDLADAALTAALAVAVSTVCGQEGEADSLSPVPSLAIIALGKCGARELNYISDVDVIFVARSAQEEHEKYVQHSEQCGGDVRERNTRVCNPADPPPEAGKMASLVMQIGSRCFFQVDAALRPEGKQGVLVRTLSSHVTYYKRWAETWEFQALLKARAMTGDRELAQRYIDEITPFIWEASQRENFVDSVQKMRTRVVATLPRQLQRRELKLGSGGLRDIEFAVQLLQMVHGRVDTTLRVAGTIDALIALTQAGYVGRDDGALLTQSYEFLRLLEHRLQLQRLRRTHTLPAREDTEALRFLARAAGCFSTNTLSSVDVLLSRLRSVHRDVETVHARLFYRPLLNSVVSFGEGTIRLTKEAAQQQLKALGYRFPARAYDHLLALVTDAHGRSRRAKIQALLLPTLMEWLGDTVDPDAGLLGYRKLSEAAEDKDWYLRMLRDEGVVGQRLMHILGTSPYATELFLASPDVVKLLGDGAGGPKLLEHDPGVISKSLISVVARHDDPEEAITVARSLRRVELARIAAADLLGMLDVRSVCRSLSLIWDAVLHAALHAQIRAHQPALATIAVIGMGRLGGAELGYGSDADVMFVCKPKEGIQDEAAVAWATKVVDKLRTSLSRPSNDPSLEVDVGLRPEGRSGALVRTITSYSHYYEQWGETWERQALMRAIPVAGDEATAQEFFRAIDTFRYPPEGADPATVRDVRTMKARIDTERLPRGADRTLHTKLGRGSLTDVEWTVQLLIMLHQHEIPELRTPSTLHALDVIHEHGLLDTRKTDILRDAWLTATKARNALVLVRGKRTDQLPQAGQHLAHVAAAAGWGVGNYQEFLDNYLKKTRRAHAVVNEIFWGES